MLIKNSTHYFNEYTKHYNIVPSPSCFVSQESRRNGFYQRLYWEFEYTKKVNGQTFYVTFTYNNAAVPRYEVDGKFYNVFSYDHFREITAGIIPKRLLRDYGSQMKFFCSCESGEGEGVRGEGNNPHYHFIFFVTPSPFRQVEYKQILQSDFLDLCREVWQGKPGFSLWKYAKYGSVKPGKFGILVNGYAALHYVSKYVTKDSSELAFEQVLADKFRSDFMSHLYDISNIKRYYYYLRSTHNKNFNHYHFGLLFDYKRYFECRSYRRSFSVSEYFDSSLDSSVISNFKDYQRWCLNVLWPDYFQMRLRDFRNKYSGKPRCSKSLGLYGLSQILDVKDDSYFLLLEKNGLRKYTPCLYYQRKLYYDVVKCPVTGNPLYVLNEVGRIHKVNTLNLVISRYYRHTLENVSRFFDNNLNFEYKQHFDCVGYLTALRASSDFLSFIYKYSVYHCVYQYRAFNSSTPVALSSKFHIDEIKEDYSLFLKYDFYVLDFDLGSVFNVFKRGSGNMPFAYLPLFKPYIDDFDFMDALNDFVDGKISDLKKKDFEYTSEHRSKIVGYFYDIASCL